MAQASTLLVLEVVVQPDVAGRVVLGDRAAVGADELRNPAFGVVGAGDVEVTGPDRAAVDAAGLG